MLFDGWSRSVTRRFGYRMCALTLLGMMGLGGFVSSRLQPLGFAIERPTLSEMNQDKNNVREGTQVSDSKGKFQWGKDRIVFVDETIGRSFTCLENLMLQRIESYLSDEESRRQRWLISGKITEFKGENYLWIDRAVRAR